MDNYYEKELSRVLKDSKSDTLLRLKVIGDAESTKWLNLDTESIPKVIGFLEKLYQIERFKNYFGIYLLDYCSKAAWEEMGVFKLQYDSFVQYLEKTFDYDRGENLVDFLKRRFGREAMLLVFTIF